MVCLCMLAKRVLAVFVPRQLGQITDALQDGNSKLLQPLVEQ